MPDYIFAALVACGLSVIVTPLVIKLAISTGAVDKPDARKVHKFPIPRIGGLGIYASFMFAVAFTTCMTHFEGETLRELIGLMTGGTLIVILGLVDDYKNLPAKVKLLGQIVAAIVLVVGFNVKIDVITNPFDGNYIFLDDWIAIPATIFWIVGLTNTVNLIDGLDGLAAGVSAIASFTILIVAMKQNFIIVTIITAALAGAAVGFLFYNSHPAKIFMGDSGSMFFGYMLAGISVVGAFKSTATIALTVPILALGLPILDTTFAIVRRYMGGRPIFQPDKGHLHHRLLSLGFTQRQAVFLMYVISAMLGLSAVALTEVNKPIAIVILIIVVVSIGYGTKKLGVLRFKRE